MPTACGTDPVQSDETLFFSADPNNSSSASISVTNRSQFQIDITEIVKGWARYNKGLSNNDYENPANGFMLTPSNSTDAYIASIEATGTTNVRYILDYSLYSGSYMFKNKNTAAYLNVDYPAPQTAPPAISASQSLTRNYSGSFVVKYVQNGKHLIMPMYDLSYALYTQDISDSYVSFQKIPTTISDRFYWRIESNSTGDSVILKNCYTETVLYGTASGVSAIRASDATVTDATNWYTARAYGNKKFRRVQTDNQGNDIDCLNYALFDNTIVGFDSVESNFLEYKHISPTGISADELPQVKAWFAEYVHAEFCNLLLQKGFNYIIEDSFTKNGEAVALSTNQYRVVLRTGFHLTEAIDDPYSTDYHFWYQTIDGRWTHKNGDLLPVLLPWGVFPESFEGGGWALDDDDDYYDGDVYCYVITVT